MKNIIEILNEGVKQFLGKIIAALLFAVALWAFPSLKKILKRKKDSKVENQTQEKEKLKAEPQEEQESIATQKYKLGMKYLNDGNFCEAVKYFLPAAEQGHAAAQYYLGHIYEWGFGVPMNKSEAVKWFEKSAAQGYTDAQDALKRLL